MLHIGLFLTGIGVVSISSCLRPCKCVSHTKQKSQALKHKQCCRPKWSPVWVPKNDTPPTRRIAESEAQNSHHGYTPNHSPHSTAVTSGHHGNQLQRTLSTSSTHGNQGLGDSNDNLGNQCATVEVDISVLNPHLPSVPSEHSSNFSSVHYHAKRMEPSRQPNDILSEVPLLHNQPPTKHVRTSSYCTAVSQQSRCQLIPHSSITPSAPLMTRQLGRAEAADTIWLPQPEGVRGEVGQIGGGIRGSSFSPPSYEDLLKTQTQI